MSRLIVKNLPNKVTVEELKTLFSQKGEVTDVQLKFTKDNKFRNFGFIGFRTEEHAAQAKDYFDGSCIRSMKISVETCSNLGDVKKPRAWSKYATDSTAYKKLHNLNEIDNTKKSKKTKEKSNKEKIKELLQKHKNDPLFTEFIDAHTNEKTAWIKEALVHSEESNGESDNDNEDHENSKEKSTENIELTDTNIKTANKKISDLEYMKSLLKKETGTNENNKPKKIRNRPLFHIKITGLPFKCKKKDLKEFFRPLVPYSIRLPLGKGKRVAGFCYIGFRTEQELNKALKKDKLFLGSHRVHIHRYVDHAKAHATELEEKTKLENCHKEINEESIGESGSIFVRNLPYVISEAEVTVLFEKYGPVTEVNMPIDKISRKPKGFATITFLMPEHAVRAYSELDGTIFAGRMLHLIPAKAEKYEDDDENLSFKEKKAKKLKSEAKSSHNWNTLFLGANAVADVIASTYNTTKEQLLTDNNKNTSAAVRLALGETQLVAETKLFLENNGVYLQAFAKMAKGRSKTCIIVKNLPANTTKDELKIVFEKFGHISRFILPKHGITALVDFIEPFEAKKAFTKLAYSQFKTAPLYLEWAPENVFYKKFDTEENTLTIVSDHESEDKQIEPKKESDNETSSDDQEVKNENEIVEEPENNTTLFVKNLNFVTTDGTLKKHFSSCGQVYNATVAKKKDTKNPGQFLSMGYGFVQYYKKEHANEALKMLQCSTLDGKTLELKHSDRENIDVKTTRKTSKEATQNGTKILVKNVPFQANRKELHEIFRAFGEIKTLRLPQKLTPGASQHRGFAFVDFYTKTDAKSAFEALCYSTHLYGRRLVMEWAEQSDNIEDINELRKRTAENFNFKHGGKKSKKASIDTEDFIGDN